MKKTLVLLPVLGLLSYVILTAYSAGPGATSPGYERTGASATSGCGTGPVSCHSTTSSSTLGVTISLMSGATPATSYAPSTAYTVQVTGTYSGTSLPKFGFQLAARNTGSTTNLGTFTATAGVTHLATPGGTGVNIVEHSSPIAASSGSGTGPYTYTINVPWTSPATGMGPVKFFAVMNAVNFNTMADAGDMWNTGTATFNESSAAVGTIGGTLTVCAGASTALTCTPAGGTWSSGAVGTATVSATGMVTGVSGGTATVTYNAGTAGNATAIVTVIAAPAAITGTASCCIGASTTLNCTPTGGTWSSGSVGIATVGSLTGVVTGVTSGTAVISYFNAAGCASTSIVTVNASGAAPITGVGTVCVGTIVHQFNLTPSGTWTSSNTAKATVGSTNGVVTGVAVGTATISYTATNSCGVGSTTRIVTVNAAGTCLTGVSPAPAATAAELSIYPNPNNGSFTLNMQSDVNEEAHVIVCNISGEKVKEFNTVTNTTVNMKLPHVAGMYFVSVTTQQGNYIARLLIQ